MAKYRYRCRVEYNPHRNWSENKRGGNEKGIAVESISDRIWSETRIGVGVDVGVGAVESISD